MKRNWTLRFKWSFLLLMLPLLVVTSCKEEDPESNEPVASFQSEVSADNFLTVTFTNFSLNGVSYAWDFGDNTSSTEESPTHTYAEAGTYEVTLTTTGEAGTTPASKSETIILSDPDAQLTLLAGTESKTWYLQREGIALGIGPNLNDNAWWSFGGVTQLGDRPCILDDMYTFHRDGTFSFDSNNTIFVDSEGNGGWLGPDAPEACYDESEALTAADGTDVSAFGNGGSYSYTYDQTAGQITLTGEGAYIGLANKTEAGDNFTPISTKNYQIISLSEGDVADSLKMAIAIDGGAGGYWNFYLVSYANEADLPAIPTSLPVASFGTVVDGFTVTFNNTSTASTSYSWDFGDGNTSTDLSPIHTYADEGVYTVTLTSSDGTNESVATAEVTISAATFSAAALEGTWMLAGANSFFVGPFAGSTEWWPGVPEADLELRACQFNDTWTFAGGTMDYNTFDDVWYEDYFGGPNACAASADVAAPFDVLTDGSHAYTVTEATDEAAATITVNGDGAFIGFAKAINGGELTADATPASSITYTVLDYASTPEKDIMTLTVDISEGEIGGAWWTIVLESAN